MRGGIRMAEVIDKGYSSYFARNVIEVVYTTHQQAVGFQMTFNINTGRDPRIEVSVNENIATVAYATELQTDVVISLVKQYI